MLRILTRVSCLSTLMALAGCVATDPPATPTPPQPSAKARAANTGLAALAEGRQTTVIAEALPVTQGGIATLAEQQADQLSQLYAEGLIGSEAARPVRDPRPATRARPTPRAASPATGLNAVASPSDTAHAGSTEPTTATEAPSPAPPPPPTPAQRVQTYAAELARAAIDRAAELGQAPETEADRARAAVLLAMLDPWLSVATPSGLSPSRSAAVDAVRDLSRRLADPASTADARALATLLADQSSSMAASLGLRLPTVSLCTRVDGYGQYDQVASARFAAGHDHPLIVYAEVEGFAARQAPGGRFAVELAPVVEIYNDAENPTLQWRRAEETIVDVSRNRRRDFYLTSVIELPRTLSVGAYRLKVSVRDGVSGALAETVVPFSIVADLASTNPG